MGFHVGHVPDGTQIGCATPKVVTGDAGYNGVSPNGTYTSAGSGPMGGPAWTFGGWIIYWNGNPMSSYFYLTDNPYAPPPKWGYNAFMEMDPPPEAPQYNHDYTAFEVSGATGTATVADGVANSWVSNLVIRTPAEALAFVPSNVTALVWAEAVDATNLITTNAVRAYVSRNAGTDWTQLGGPAVIYALNTTNSFVRFTGSMTNQPAGSNIVLRVEGTNAVRMRVKGWATTFGVTP